MTLYSSLADNIAQRIDSGLYTPGDRLPGIRTVSQSEGVSPSTVVSAYHYLENAGYIEARPRSGYYVRVKQPIPLQDPKLSKPSKKPQPVNGQAMVLQLIQNLNEPGLVQLGANIPDKAYLPSSTIDRASKKAMKKFSAWTASYVVPPGLPQLRQQIARRMTVNGCPTNPDEILITSGCQEAIYLTLKSLTVPGDVIAVESPTYYGLLQIIDSLGLKALEIPTDARHGISIQDLEHALEQWPIKACVVVPNFSNPLGARIPDDAKQQLIKLFSRHPDVFLIEDDIYGDLYFEGNRPSLIKSLDKTGNVIHCASFSKTLSPALRIGWIVTSQGMETMEYQKFVTNCAANSHGQITTSEILSTGFYDRHLRSLRLALNRSMDRVTESIVQHFPKEIKASRPNGGMCLWLELPKDVNCTKVAHQALERGISIAPGAIFSSSQTKYQNFMRLNCAVDPEQDIDTAIKTLASLIKRSE